MINPDQPRSSKLLFSKEELAPDETPQAAKPTGKKPNCKCQYTNDHPSKAIRHPNKHEPVADVRDHWNQNQYDQDHYSTALT